MLSLKYRLAAYGLGALVLAGITAPVEATRHGSPRMNASILDMPSGPWPFARQGPQGYQTYWIPSQLDEIKRLPEPDRSTSLSAIREHQRNMSVFNQTVRHFFGQLDKGNIDASPEYTMNLGEVVMALDFDNIRKENPLFAHEPLLRALPDYTRVVLFVPEAVIPQVKRRLREISLSSRVRIVVSQEKSRFNFGDGITRWVRDIMFVGQEHGLPLVVSSLAHKRYADVSHHDLGYLDRIGGGRRHFLRMPIFFRGGNLAVAKAGRKLLIVGADELAMNQQWFVEAVGFQPPLEAVPDILKAVTGSDEVLILPNSRNLFHLDMFIVPLADGMIGLLAPVDPEHLEAADRNVLSRAGTLLKRSGFQIVSIPTSVERIRQFESPVNIVSFTDSHTGRHRALVPQFPEPAGLNKTLSLNARALEAFRSAGVDPIPVEDRFHVRGGNIHCALVSLR